jgi:hypothetical protein
MSLKVPKFKMAKIKRAPGKQMPTFHKGMKGKGIGKPNKEVFNERFN